MIPQFPLQRILQDSAFSNKWADIQITYMGFSLNGGTPKTPQNDHF